MGYLKLLAAIAVIGSIAWVIARPGYDSAIAVVTSLAALVGAFVEEKRRARRAQQHQSISESSFGIQAGRDVNLGDIGRKKDVE